MQITKDLLSGLMFCAFGVGAIIVAQDYSFGTPSRMGSGFFPIAIGVLVALIGAAIAIRAMVRPGSSEPVATIEIRPLLFIAIAIVVFGLIVDDLGLLAALAALILIARLAGREGSLAELAVMVVVLSAIAIGIFVYGLNIPLDVVPR